MGLLAGTTLPPLGCKWMPQASSAAVHLLNSCPGFCWPLLCRDDIDAFVLQVEGSKRWRLYAHTDPQHVLPRCAQLLV